MTKKNKHITSVFLRLSGTSLFIFSLLILIFIIASRKEEEVNYATELSENITVNISHLGIHIEKAFYLQKTDDTFVSSLSENLIVEHNRKINQLIDTIGNLRKIRYIQAHYGKDHFYDTLISKLNNHKQNYELTIYSLKEKGNLNGGIIGELFNKTVQLSQELIAIPDSGKLENQFQEISGKYFRTLEINDLLSLEQFITELPTSFYYFEDFDALLADKYITDIQELLGKLKTVETRLLGNEEYDGQIKQLNDSMLELAIYVNKQSSSIVRDNAHYKKVWIIIFIVITIILSIVIILMYSKLLFYISKSVRNILNITSDITKGSIQSEIHIDPLPDFKEITKNLQSHNQELLNRKNFITELLEEKFDREMELLSDSDEFGVELNKLELKLLTVQKDQDKRTQENEIRRYINEGLAKFADIMRVNSNNTEALGDNLVKNLVKYLNAIQGTLFLTDEEDEKILNLIAAFAFDRKKYLKKTIKYGEGLIGTCAIELKTINLTKVPPNYALIKSGLGDTPPNNILIVPVKHDNKIVGVLELASLNSYNEHEIDLTEQIADNLASTIISVRNNTKTAQLLEKSQHQAVEMAEQEEEMRQNMEELKATQEESARREEEMQGMLDAIGTTFYVIEYSIDGIIEHINDKLVQFLEQPYDSIIGKKHSDIFSSESIITIDLITNKIVEDKKSQKIVEELNWGSKKFNYTHLISPIVSKQNEVIKIINLMIIEEN
jgi:PAS domain-containing protein